MEKEVIAQSFSLNFKDLRYHFILQINTDCKDFMVEEEEEVSRNYWSLDPQME